MNDATANALAGLNSRFYDATGEAFGATRQRGWRGWKRLLPLLARLRAGRPLRVLDLGCGNGRLAGFLREAELPCEYLGLDASEQMLAQARHQYAEQSIRFEACALHDPGSAFGSHMTRGFDLVAVFGVMHHLPGRARRSEFLARAWQCVAPGGIAALSWWRFQRDARFSSRRIAWSDPQAMHDPDVREIDRSELEEGDALLRFGEEPGPPRYCHFATDDEIDALIGELEALGAIAIERFDDDGHERRLNHYALLRRPPASG